MSITSTMSVYNFSQCPQFTREIQCCKWKRKPVVASICLSKGEESTNLCGTGAEGGEGPLVTSLLLVMLLGKRKARSFLADADACCGWTFVCVFFLVFVAQILQGNHTPDRC